MIKNNLFKLLPPVLFLCLYPSINPIGSASKNSGTTPATTIGTYQWEYAKIPTLTTTKIKGVTYGTPGFVASAVDQKTKTPFILFSKDGKQWSQVKTSSAPEHPKWGNGFFAGGVKKRVNQKWVCSLGYSKDGKKWNETPTPGFCVLDMVWGGSKFLAVTAPGIEESTPITIYSTRDFKTWTLEYKFEDTKFYGRGIQLIKGAFFVSGFKGALYRSTDGKTWQPVVAPKGPMHSTSNIIWDGKRYVVPKYDMGEILSSTDGINWNHQQVGYANTSSDYMNIYSPENDNTLFDGTYYYGLVNNGKEACLSFSITANSWTCSKNYLYSLNKKFTPGVEMFIASGNNISVAVFHTARYGSPATDISPVILYGQPQAITTNAEQKWDEALIGPAGESIEIHTLASNGKIYVAAGGAKSYSNASHAGDKQGFILVSEDKVHWRKINQEFAAHIYSIIWTPKGFYGVGLNGLVITSPDGLSWKQQKNSIKENLSRIYYLKGRFIALGGNGGDAKTSLFVSADGKNWEKTYDSSKEKYPEIRSLASDGTSFLVALYNKIMISSDTKNWKEAARFEKPELASVKIVYLIWDGTAYNIVTEERKSISTGGNHRVSDPVRIIYTSADGLNWKKYQFSLNSKTPYREVVLVDSPKGASFNSIVGYDSDRIYTAKLWGSTNWNTRMELRNDLTKKQSDGAPRSFLHGLVYNSDKKEFNALVLRNGAFYLATWR